jgi:archaellum biogenesis ATPase FlaH
VVVLILQVLEVGVLVVQLSLYDLVEFLVNSFEVVLYALLLDVFFNVIVFKVTSRLGSIVEPEHGV